MKGFLFRNADKIATVGSFIIISLLLIGSIVLGLIYPEFGLIEAIVIGALIIGVASLLSVIRIWKYFNNRGKQK